MNVSITVVIKLILSFLVVMMPKVTKITSSQYLFSLYQEKKKSKVDCLDTDKHQSFL